MKRLKLPKISEAFYDPQSAGNDIGSLEEALMSEKEREGGIGCIKRKRKFTILKDCMKYSNNRVYFKEMKHMNKSCAVCYSYTNHPSDTSLIKNGIKIAVIVI